jgi:DeoR family glycerol-3-phosphate regulon repressor
LKFLFILQRAAEFPTYRKSDIFLEDPAVQRDVTQRRDAIIALLSENDMLSAMALSFELDVSVQTIRADLRDLDEAGLVQRRNGTVRLCQQSENTGYLPREGIAG